ncbi:DUF1310 family protein [Streptococcus sp. zg-86]|uniref:DUF1310 family protein n=1 Tax=Streptococcus zhangguiae TaxID=2664091 RepID=A0A6I4RGE5_9STRE|nr:MULTISPECIES: DUF1310 family protein [unclassified Streptococcus]MTB63949.1 DUF1310 family protein [Streptococcus sp. zg-86]MTB90259.1 DUF1310 family protein [Streptococcus sp. zg-36]MWV55937.1 DUF1310 family protein [Streptococcus sp. zg-70]QTH46978.1 DUF1310 family protein [Streptococcus sp. zg-86]
MKTWLKWILGIVASLSVIIGVVVLEQVNRQEQLKQEMMEFVQSKEVERVIEKMLKREDPQALTDGGTIKNYSIIHDSIEHNPMGGVMFDILINSNEEYSVGFILYKGSRGDVEVSSTSWSEAIINLLEGERE